MGSENEYRTKEDFARSFVPAFKDAMRIAAGKEKGSDAMEHVMRLIAETENTKKEDVKNAN